MKNLDIFIRYQKRYPKLKRLNEKLEIDILLRNCQPFQQPVEAIEFPILRLLKIWGIVT